MQKLILKEINFEGALNIDIAESLLNSHAEFQVIEEINWSSHLYKPEIKFKIAYCQDQLLLKYWVTEESVVAKITEVNGEVYKDSCVEFFLSTKKDSTYYNFEVNCIGTTYAAHGIADKNRSLIDPEIVKLIKTKSSLGNKIFEEKTGGHKWEILVIIPKECLIKDKDITLKGLKASANFYKCGDETIKPHFVSWNPIKFETPNFHLPEYFGEISFE